MQDNLFRMFGNINLQTVLNQFLAESLKGFKTGVDQEFDQLIDQLLSKRQPIYNSFNPFDILGVSPAATEEEIKQAYRDKARKEHPDHGGSSEEMAKINLAYEAIKRFRGWS
jgi:DnaJ-class molecular chaperone